MPPGAELPPHRHLQTHLPAEPATFLQWDHGDTVPRPCGSGLRLCWLHFVYLNPNPMTGAWLA